MSGCGNVVVVVGSVSVCRCGSWFRPSIIKKGWIKVGTQCQINLSLCLIVGLVHHVTITGGTVAAARRRGTAVAAGQGGGRRLGGCGAFVHAFGFVFGINSATSSLKSTFSERQKRWMEQADGNKV